MQKYKIICVDIFMPGIYEGPRQETKKEILISTEELQRIIETKGHWLVEKSFLENPDRKEDSDTTIVFLENSRSAGFDGLIFWREVHISRKDMQEVSSEEAVENIFSV